PRLLFALVFYFIHATDWYATRLIVTPVYRGDGLAFEPPVAPSGLRSTAPLLPPAGSSIFCEGACCALATLIPPTSVAAANRVVLVFMHSSCIEALVGRDAL